MRVKVRRAGDNFTVTIPEEVAAELAIDENTQMSVVVRDGAMVLEPVVSRWDGTVAHVRTQAAERGLTERDVTDALAEIRGRDCQ